jgi:uncharacterized protein YutD
MLEELIRRYKKIIKHVKFIVRTERERELLTLNNNFNKNLQKTRMERFITNIRGYAITVYNVGSSYP